VAEHGDLVEILLRGERRRERLTHLERIPARTGVTAPWPTWVPESVRDALVRSGIETPWRHQVDAAESVWSGQSMAISTGTASGKSLAYLLPGLSWLATDDHNETEAAALGPRPTVLYISPTKALAADQLTKLHDLRINGVLEAAYDGDASDAMRIWARQQANWISTNPDMLHFAMLPGHQRWSRFWHGLRLVVLDECHVYRGVFGANVAAVVRRLRRVAALYGASPIFVVASATVASPAVSAERLTGVNFAEVTRDDSPHAPVDIALWEPPLLEGSGSGSDSRSPARDEPVRRSAVAESADLLADLVVAGARTLAFTRSRRGAEVVALAARDHVAEVDASLTSTIAAYRGGYLPQERRELEADLRSGALLGLATTSALELGVDVSGLDAVLIAGWPGTRASMWQRFGRAGRRGHRALGVFIAREDPLDTFIAHHPSALFDAPVEAAVFDPDNPVVLGPHLCAAAAESPVTEADVELFGPTTIDVLDDLVAGGLLRRRAAGWFWTANSRAADLVDLRGSGEPAVQIVEADTGRLLGTVDASAAHSAVHEGAVYVHQGESFVVAELRLDEHVALVAADDPDYTTWAREVASISIVSTDKQVAWGQSVVCFGSVESTSRVISYVQRRIATNEVIGEHPLDLPERVLRTKAVWWVPPPGTAVSFGPSDDLAGAAHAAEHASIGLLPLFATCDRWDLGGVSTALHPDTGMPTVFVYDGHPGGAGFAARGFEQAAQWLRATRDAIASCECADGCPSCVQSPKCGNGNEPLDKAGAIRLLDIVLADAPSPTAP
jgi:DEAD/DEAH box helicase domain-containing protein